MQVVTLIHQFVLNDKCTYLCQQNFGLFVGITCQHKRYNNCIQTYCITEIYTMHNSLNYSRFHLLAFIFWTRWIYLLMNRKNWKMKETVCKSGTFGFCTIFCWWRKYRLDRSHQEPWLYCAHDSDLNLRYTSFPSDTVFKRRPTSWRREIDFMRTAVRVLAERNSCSLISAIAQLFRPCLLLHGVFVCVTDRLSFVESVRVT